MPLEMRKILETSEYMTPGWAFQHVFKLWVVLGSSVSDVSFHISVFSGFGCFPLPASTVVGAMLPSQFNRVSPKGPPKPSAG